ncbi:tol-pal system-associated acyl-CoA thioesterase [Legionella micdadei]|uniref:tol-pal system-associated acyl-CoA thioesterase n=1 Tax=Legionella micdadei TaxID=451 RepID=UPI0009EF73B4|nr:tol-pal system-associated acyl-CoA thioesterase [Legionella micdadei]ARG97651.1 tol-pal system-associated acyl-CoA thioesterase [Legionella micdadei]ARH00034.1 tol-pal system-associated acyl-CoA thioesterase [Legionella micdadei]NSL17725.1 tol-pal system-associated acyl-CoA thioesterase [Legionella micdadei]
MDNMDCHHFNIRVYAEDTDMMGIVYHANYLCFFERARTEMIRNSGLSLTMLATYDCHFAINEVLLRYKNPAYLDDLLRITTKISNKKSCSLVFDQAMHNQDNKLICEAQIKAVCVNNEMRPKRLPEDLFKLK